MKYNSMLINMIFFCIDTKDTKVMVKFLSEQVQQQGKNLILL